MRSIIRVWLPLLAVLAVILLSVVQPSDAEYKSSHSTQMTRNKKATCDCRYASDSPLCASNGVTYPNMCRFDCAKTRVKRLRVVSSGTCRGKTLNDYRRNQKKG